MIACDSDSSASGPKASVPRHKRLTTSPLRPRCVYSICRLLRSSFQPGIDDSSAGAIDSHEELQLGLVRLLSLVPDSACHAPPCRFSGALDAPPTGAASRWWMPWIRLRTTRAVRSVTVPAP